MDECRQGPYGPYVRDKDKLIKRLCRIEGQIRGLQRMVQEDRYCVDILAQILPSRARPLTTSV
ncbi:MAG: metal-sensitive transcriptional regulator [Desulfotomaculales bacterium]